MTYMTDNYIITVSTSKGHFTAVADQGGSSCNNFTQLSPVTHDSQGWKEEKEVDLFFFCEISVFEWLSK